MGHYKVREQELFFVLKDQLKYEQLCKYDRYKDLTETSLDMTIKEGINFARGIIEPLQEPAEKFGTKFEDGKVTCFPGFKDAFKKSGEDGWIAISRERTYGGEGFPLIMRIVVNDIFYGACYAFQALPVVTQGSGHLIESFGTDELKKLYVRRMYTGKWSGCMVLTEPEAGSDLGNIQTTAYREGDHFRIKGNKLFITYGEHDVADNIICLVLARIEGAPPGTKGISLFVVPKIRVNKDGNFEKTNDIKCLHVEEKMGLHGAPTVALSFGDNDDCIGYLCGKENKGLSHMFQMLNQGRFNSAVCGLTLASTAYLNALEYCKERKQGADLTGREKGMVHIIEHPDVRRMLLWMKAVVEGLRSMIYLAAFYSDLALCEEDSKKKHHYQLLLNFMTPLIKAHATHRGLEVCNTAMQCFGGHGYICDYPIEQYLRDIRLLSLYEGTNGIQAIALTRRMMKMEDGATLKAFKKEIKSFVASNKKNSTFEKELLYLDKVLNSLIAVSKQISGNWDSNPLEAAWHASPLLSCIGDLILVWRLLDMAIIAEKILDKESGKGDFYRGKIMAARYFARETLPKIQSDLIIRQQESRELIEITPNCF